MRKRPHGCLITPWMLEVAKLGQDKKAELADRLEEVAHQLIEILPAKVSDATLQQVATALGSTRREVRQNRRRSLGKSDLMR